MFNLQEMQARWNEVVRELQQRWKQLNEQDLRKFTGNIDELVALIQRKTGETQAAIQGYLEELSRRNVPRGDGATAAGQYAEQAAQAVQVRYSEAEKIIRRNPLQSAAAAFGVGVLAGTVMGLIGRRH